MINPIRWWLAWTVDFYFWWKKGRRPSPKPMTAKRCRGGHLLQGDGGCGTCSGN